MEALAVVGIIFGAIAAIISVAVLGLAVMVVLGYKGMKR